MSALKILIIEDDLIIATDLRGHMEEAGYLVTGIARDMKEAMRLVKNNPPDLAIIDITLGNIEDEGIRIAKEILGQHWIPFIYLTAHSDEDMIRRGAETAPSAYLFKPFRVGELLVQIRLALEHFVKRVNADTSVTPKTENLYFPSKTGHVRVRPDEILFLKAQGHCTDIYVTYNKKPQMIGTNLGMLEKYFTTRNFIRLSKSLFINLDHLKQIERTHIYMGEDKLPVEISETNRKELLRSLKIVRTK
jgi:DNA-binding LytR/AlgR family response regulator